MNPEQISRLRDPSGWPAGSTPIDLVETHISWVILAGNFAYKVRKPVKFGFVDFSTLEKRREDCEREQSLNETLSPGLYLGVVPIRLLPDGSLRAAEGPGEVVEYAVKMRRFDEAALFSRLLAVSALTTAHIEAFADRLVEVHRQAEVAPADSLYGTARQVKYWSDENLDEISAMVAEPVTRHRIEVVLTAVNAEFGRAMAAIVERREGGFIRDCHGDLHLGNVLWLEDKAVLFDRIEFNDELRWIDVQNDLAFAVMDLIHEGRDDLGWRLLNRYLKGTGDYRGVIVLRFYMVYRALVRTKVALLGCADPGRVRSGDVPAFQSHLALCERLLEERAPTLTITCGLSGSGKTTRALARAAETGAVVIHTDVERKRLFNLAPHEASGAALNAGIYAPATSERVYRLLADLAVPLIDAGYSVIVDGAFLRRGDRDRFRRLASEHGVGFAMLYCKAPAAELRDRIVARMKQGTVSEATLEVLDHQLATAELPDAEELAAAVGSSAGDP